MIVEVGEHKLKIDKSPVNELEVNITKIEFKFPSSMDGLVKKAFFTQEDVSKEVLLLTNECDIPSEVLFKQGQVRLGVIAYETDGDVLKERFNPTPCYFQVDEGSLIDADNTEPITPTDKEQIEQALTNLQNNKQDTLVSGENIKTINNESLLGSGNLEVITDLSDYYTKEQTNDLLDTKQDKSSMSDYYKKTETYSKSEVDTIKTTIESEIPTKLSQLDNDKGFIDKSVNNLENYSKTSEMNTAISNAVGIETTNRQNSDVALQNQIDAITSSSDVVDVVSTYQDLLDYDTSKLTDKDVIKVMQDSTHSNALSYYRWNTSTFDYVGSEGPFYTKGETDTLLNAKQNTIDNSHKLASDLVDDTNHTHKFVSETEKTNWNNKSDFSGSYNDLTNKPDLTLKEDKSNKVVSISSSSNDTQYPSAKCVYDSQVSQDTQIEQLQEENTYLNSIIDQLPRVNGTGDTITLNNTIEAKMKSKLSPSEMEQETTTGKNRVNIFDANAFKYGNGTNKTTVASDGVITCTANFSGTRAKGILIENLKQNTNYTISLIIDSITTESTTKLCEIESVAYNSDDTYNTIILQQSTGTIGSVVQKTFNSGTYDKIAVHISGFYTSGSTGTLVYHNLMVEEGSSATDYEPYTNGASPNPQYPQGIHTTTGDNVIRVEGKNLFDGELELGYYNNSTGEKVNANDLYRNKNIIAVEPSTTYTLSINGVSQKYVVLSYDQSKGFLSSDTGLTTGTFTTASNCYYINFRCFSGDFTSDFANLKIQLEKGSSATPYEPYTLDTYPLTLGTLEYSKIGNYEDEFIYNTTDTNLQLNKWYKRNKIYKFTLNGDETWKLANTTDDYLYFQTDEYDNLIDISVPDMFVNMFSKLPSYSTQTNGYIVISNERHIRFRFDKTKLNDISTIAKAIESWKSWLSSNNIIGYFVLATPEYTLCNDTLQTQLTNIYNNMMSKKGTTNISQVNDDLPMVITASALLDLNTLVQ